MNRTATALALLASARTEMAFCGVFRLAMVLHHSLNDTFGGNSFFWVDGAWYVSVLSSPGFW
jgi:hypothetical protein